MTSRRLRLVRRFFIRVPFGQFRPATAGGEASRSTTATPLSPPAHEGVRGSNHTRVLHIVLSAPGARFLSFSFESLPSRRNFPSAPSTGYRFAAKRLPLLLDSALPWSGRLRPRRIRAIRWQRIPNSPRESVFEVVEARIANPVVLVIGCPALAELVGLEWRARDEKRSPAELTVVVIPIRTPKKVETPMKNDVLPALLGVPV